MPPRTELQSLLENILGTDHVYYQPPPNFSMEYPAIVYQRIKVRSIFADNYPYSKEKMYSVTFICKDPDSDIPDKILSLQKCLFDRHFVTDNLNHDVFNIYY